MPSKKINPINLTALCVDISSEGLGVFKSDELVLFAPHAVPGDLCELKIYKKKKNYAEAEIVSVLQESKERTQAVCSHFGTCGGCKWQQMTYAAQLRYKEKSVYDALVRIGKLELKECRKIIGSVHQYYYRNKLDFSFASKKWLKPEDISNPEITDNKNGLGFHIPKLFDKVIDIQECHLQADPSNQIRNAVREYAKLHQLSYYDHRAHCGLLRNLIIRTSTTGELMTIFSFGQNEQEEIQKLLHYIQSEFPQITSLLFVINTKKNETIHDQEILVFSGKDHITEKMENLHFKIGPKSFYQTNSLQAFELYKITRELAGINADELVYDLYTGTGTIACFVASQAKKVIGIEYVEQAVEDARINAQLNQVKNVSFYSGDMKDILTQELYQKEGVPDVIITDPPRAGMHGNVIKQILESKAKRIVYVSCNPSTQARDLELMKESYEMAVVQPVDMFPQTQHVENVVLLLRK